MGCKILKLPKTGHLTLSGKIFHRQGGTCYGESMYQIRNIQVHPLRSYEWLCKMQKIGWFGVVKGHSRSWAMSPWDRAHTTSYSTSIETMRLCCTVFTARCYASAVLAMALCPSLTSRSSTKTAKRRITQTTPHDSPGTLVFGCQRSPRNSTGITPCGGAKCRWGGSKSATFDK